MKSSIKWCLNHPFAGQSGPGKGRTPSEPKCSSGRGAWPSGRFGDEKNLGKPWEIPCFDGGVDGKNQGKTMGNHGNIWENPLFLWKFDWEKHGEIREDPLLMQVSGEEYCNLPLAREVVQAEFLPFPSNASSKCIVPKWFWGTLSLPEHSEVLVISQSVIHDYIPILWPHFFIKLISKFGHFSMSITGRRMGGNVAKLLARNSTPRA